MVQATGGGGKAKEKPKKPSEGEKARREPLPAATPAPSPQPRRKYGQPEPPPSPGELHLQAFERRDSSLGYPTPPPTYEEPGSTFDPPDIIFQDAAQPLPTPDPYELQALADRSAAIPQDFVQEHPADAAALLASSIPTNQLASVVKTYNEALGWTGEQTSIAEVPYFLVPFYERAFNSPTPERRVLALDFLDTVREQPPTEMYGYLNAHMQEFDDLTKDYSIGAMTSQAVGGILMAGPHVLTAGARGSLNAAGLGFGALGWERGREFTSMANDAIGNVAHHAGTYAGYGARVFEGVAATTMRYGLVFPAVVGKLQGGEFNPATTWTRYVPTWSEYTAGQHSGATQAAFDYAGLDIREYGNFATIFDMAVDTGVFAGGMRVLGGIRTQMRTPTSMGGWMSPQRFVTSGPGKRLIGRIAKVNKDLPEDQRAAAIIEHAPKTPARLAGELAKQGTNKADIARVLAEYADDNPTPARIAEALARKNEIDTELTQLEYGDPRYPVPTTAEAPVKGWYDWQNQTVEAVPKALRGRNTGKSLEQAMDIGREIALKGESDAAYLGYVAEKVASLRRSVEMGRLAGDVTSPADVAAVEGLLRSFTDYAGPTTSTLGEVRALVEAVARNEPETVLRILDTIEARLATAETAGKPVVLSRSQIDRIVRQTDKPVEEGGGGATFDPRTSKMVKEGTAVGAAPEEALVMKFTPEQWANPRVRNKMIRQYMEEHPEFSDPRTMVGTWKDPRTGEIHFGPTEVVASTSEGISLGVARGEYSVYDLARQEEILTPRPEAPVASPRSIALLAERAAIEQRMVDWNAKLRSPLWEWPRVSRLSEVAYGVAPGVTGRVWNFLIHDGMTKLGLDPRKLFDDLSPHDQVLYNPQFRDHIPGALEHNYRVLRINLRTAHVPEAAQRVLIDEMLRVKTRSDFYQFREHVSDAIEAGLKQPSLAERALGVHERNLANNAVAQEAIRFSNRTAQDAALAPYHVEAVAADGTVVRSLRNAAERADGRAIPTQANELIAHTSLPSIEVMRQASSTIHYWDNALRSQPRYGKVYATMALPIDVSRFMLLTLPRMVMKPILLVTRSIPIGLKIQIDQGLREFAMGMRPLATWERHNIDMLPGGVPIAKGVRNILPKNHSGEPNVSMLGVLKDSPMLDAERVRYPVPTRNIDPNLEPQTVVQVSYGIYDQLNHIHGSDLAREIARVGPDEAYRYIQTHPDSAAALEWRELAPDISAVMTPEEFFSNKWAQIQEVTGGRADLRQAIVTGQWKRAAQAKTISHATERARTYEGELRDIRALEEQARLGGNEVLRQELAARFEAVEQKIYDILQEAEDSGGLMALSNKKTVGAALREEWANKAYTPPENVYVERTLGGRLDEVSPSGVMGKVHKQAARFSNFLYRGMGPVGAADLRLTRGSMYHQELTRIQAQLVKAGWDPNLALEVAHYRASFNVRDLMYDLSARSSFDRATKDIFWFAPVLREQLHTWLVKIPAQSYWPVGFPLMVGSTSNLLKDMEALGVTRRDSNGELLVKFPLISDLVGHLVGQPLEFRLDSINPVTPGGSKLYPTAAPGLEAIMEFGSDHAPASVRGLVKTLNNVFTFDEGEEGVSWVPSGVSALFQAIGVNVPYKDQWNPTMWHNADRLADVQAIQWAVSDALKDGVKPPPPGSSEEEWEAFEADIQSRAAGYQGGLRAVRFLGNLVSPMSIVTIPPAAAAYYTWRDKQGFEYPYSDEDYQAIRDYVSKHPEALPYTIGRYKDTEQNLLPEDAPLAEKIEAGDLIAFTGGEYYIKSWTVMGMAAEESRLRQDLRDAGLVTASDRLNHFDRYTSVMAQHIIRLDDWFRANPEVEQYLKSRSDLNLTPEEERALDATRLLKAIEEEGGLKNVSASEIGAVRRALFEATQDVVFGEPDARVGKQMNWWFENVYDDYRAQVDPLYDRREKLFAEGKDGAAFKVSERIRDINNQFNQPITHDGERFPSPEEYTFMRKGARQRRTQVLDWTFSRPTTLSDFQLDTVGMPEFQGRARLIAELSRETDNYYQALSDPHLTDDMEAAIKRNHIAAVQRIAAPYGPAGQQFARLSEGTPADRLTFTSFGTGSWYWMVLTSEASKIIDYANQQGVSPRYASASSGLFDMKVEFERKVQFFRKIDPDVDALFRMLEPAAAPFGADRRLGVPLYEYVFFGQSENAYNYQDPLVAAVERTP